MPSPPQIAIIEALQQRIATRPPTEAGISPQQLANTNASAVYTQAPTRPEEPPNQATNQKFALLSGLLMAEGVPIGRLDEDPRKACLHPCSYLSGTPTGLKMLDWLADYGSHIALAVSEYITERHNQRPLPPNQHIKIDKNPIHAWIAFRKPMIERITAKESFAGLLQEQERLLSRLGAIWDGCMKTSPRPEGLVSEFNQMLDTHVEQLPLFSTKYRMIHIGPLPQTFFRYEMLLWFLPSQTDKLGLREEIEKRNPTFKLHRLLHTKATYAKYQP